MAIAYFQIQLSVSPMAGGEANLVPPPAFDKLDFRFVVVKDGGTEAIVCLDAPDAQLKKVEKESGSKRLNPTQIEALEKSYPPPKLKKKYRLRPQTTVSAQGAGESMYEVDTEGRPIIDTIQTVRSGFYLIDIPIHDFERTS